MGRFNSGASTNLLHISCDVIAAIVAFFLSLLLSGSGLGQHFTHYFLACLMFILIYILANKDARVYNVTTFFYTDRILKHVSKSFLLATSITSTLLFYSSSSDIDRNFYFLFLFFMYILLLISAFIVRYIIKHSQRLVPRVMLVGSIESFSKFEHFLGRSNMNYNIIGYVSPKPTTDQRYLGMIESLDSLAHKHAIDQVFIMHKQTDVSQIQPYIDMCINMGVTMRIIMNSYKKGNAQSYVSSIGTYPVVTYHTVSLNRTSRAVKRIIDIIGSSVAIIIFSPLMLITALAVKIDSKGPVLFKQERIGLNGRRFKILKFRSMCINADDMKKELMQQNEMGDGGFMFKMKDDPRITRVGKFIRKTSLDEFPQFFNVLFGDMSLVGTRPPTPDEVERYELVHWRRLSIKPGITGMWQVSGRSSITDFNEIVELDTQYIDRWGIFLDFQIIFRTAWNMLFQKKDAF